MKHIPFLIVLVFALNGTIIRAEDAPLHVLASTSIIADVARHVGGDRVEVTALVPPGADAHSFNPSPRDVAGIAEADLVLVNGMRLEESLLDVIVANASRAPVVVSRGVRVRESGHSNADDDPYLGVLGADLDCADPLIPEIDDDHSGDDDHEHGPCDPHVWLDVVNVMIWTQNIADALAAVDPGGAAAYAENAATYIEELEALDAELREMIEPLPEDARMLVTNHDFLGYFAAAYDFTVIGTVVPGVSTAAEANPQDLARLVETIKTAGVRAIFAETSDNTRLAEALAAEVDDVQVVELYSGSLSDEDEPAATYIEYMRFNVEAIVAALGG